MLNTKIFGTQRGVLHSIKIKPKHRKRSLIQCECCRQMRHKHEVKHMGELPMIYICYKCLKEKDGEADA